MPISARTELHGPEHIIACQISRTLQRSQESAHHVNTAHTISVAMQPMALLEAMRASPGLSCACIGEQGWARCPPLAPLSNKRNNTCKHPHITRKHIDLQLQEDTSAKDMHLLWPTLFAVEPRSIRLVVLGLQPVENGNSCVRTGSSDTDPGRGRGYKTKAADVSTETQDQLPASTCGAQGVRSSRI